MREFEAQADTLDSTAFEGRAVDILLHHRTLQQSLVGCNDL